LPLLSIVPGPFLANCQHPPLLFPLHFAHSCRFCPYLCLPCQLLPESFLCHFLSRAHPPFAFALLVTLLTIIAQTPFLAHPSTACLLLFIYCCCAYPSLPFLHCPFAFLAFASITQSLNPSLPSLSKHSILCSRATPLTHPPRSPPPPSPHYPRFTISIPIPAEELLTGIPTATQRPPSMLVKGSVSGVL